MADRLLNWSWAAVEGDHVVAAAHQAVDHVAAHAAKANEAELHRQGLQSMT
jgi:hypothetical protein